MTSESWSVIAKRADFKKIADENGIDQVTARLLVNRGVPGDSAGSFLHPSENDLLDPYMMTDMDSAVSVISSCIDDGVRIRVIGDYDVDGINSTYILHCGLSMLGAVCDYAIPRRIEDGYGLNPSMVGAAYDAGIGCIVTCDNGIAAAEATALAMQKGMKVVVTDHHTVPYELTEDGKKDILPPSDACVDPHRDGDAYPFKDICGAVVAWKLILCLFEKAGLEKERAFSFIENAAFATVCDVMPLLGENRVIVALGLKRMSSTKNLGLRCLISRLSLEGKSLTAYHMGFMLGPCFNATGRLDTASLAMQLLSEESEEEAVRIAAEIVAMNDERKQMTERGVALAMKEMESWDLKRYPVIVLFLPDIHESICGLVAGRLKETFYHPVFVLTRGEGCVKGSGRSIEAYPMYDRMKVCERLYIKWGGHPMAAGLSLNESDIGALKEGLNEAPCLSEEDFVKKIMIDVPMPLSYLAQNTKVIDELSLMEPCGTGNPKALFAEKELAVKKIRTIGKGRTYYKLQFGSGIEGVYFGDSGAFRDYFIEKSGRENWDNAILGKENDLRVSIVYEAGWNEYNGTKTPQVVIRHFK